MQYAIKNIMKLSSYIICLKNMLKELEFENFTEDGENYGFDCIKDIFRTRQRAENIK